MASWKDSPRTWTQKSMALPARWRSGPVCPAASMIGAVGPAFRFRTPLRRHGRVVSPPVRRSRLRRRFELPRVEFAREQRRDTPRRSTLVFGRVVLGSHTCGEQGSSRHRACRSRLGGSPKMAPANATNVASRGCADGTCQQGFWRQAVSPDYSEPSAAWTSGCVDPRPDRRRRG